MSAKKTKELFDKALEAATVSLYKKKLAAGSQQHIAHNETLDEIGGRYVPELPFPIDTKRQAVSRILNYSPKARTALRKHVKPQTWKVHSLDVWGNAKDGYDVNNEFSAGTVEIPEGATDEELLKIFKGEFLDKHLTLRTVEFDNPGSESFFAIKQRKDGKPVYHVYLQYDRPFRRE